MGYIWDEVFVTGKMCENKYPDVKPKSDQAKLIACATAMSGWANCMCRAKPPENFGFGMIALADWSGLTPADLFTDRVSETANKYQKNP